MSAFYNGFRILSPDAYGIMATTRLTFYLIPSIHRVLITEKYTPALPYYMPLDGSIIRAAECEPKEVIAVKEFWRFLHVKDDWFIAHERLIYWINNFSEITKFPEVQFEQAASAISEDHLIKISACETVPEIGCTYGQLRRYINHGARSRSGDIVKIQPVHTPNGKAITIKIYRDFIEKLQQ